MSILNEQIQNLQNKLKKIEFLEHILNSTKSYDLEDYKTVKDEVVELLETFVVATIKGIEYPAESEKEPITSKFSSEDLEVLKTVVEKVKSKPVNQVVTVKNNPNSGVFSTEGLAPEAFDTNTKLSFAMENRHLANKKVSIANDKNMTITGEVVGFDAPIVLVKTDSGPVIKVPLENIGVI